MIITHPLLQNSIDVDGSSVQILVIESPRMRAAILSELNRQILGGSGRFKVYEKNEIPLHKCLKLVFNPFELCEADKEIQSALVGNLVSLALDEDHYLETNELLSSISRYVNGLCMEIDSELVSEPLSATELVKMSKPGFYSDGLSFVDSLVRYMDNYSMLLPNKILVFVGLRCFLSSDDYELFKKHVVYKKIKLILVEFIHQRPTEYESVRIIDSDLCEIGDFGNLFEV